MGARCARRGCRAWAVRGAPYCWAHRQDAALADDDGLHDEPDAREERVAAFNALVTQGAEGDLVARAVRAVVGAMTAGAAEAPLDGEIRALRLILSRVIALDALEGEPREVAQTVTKLVDTIVRAVRAQHGLVGDDGDALQALVAAALDELGLGAQP